MCEALPLKNIPRKKFEFKKSKFGFIGKYECYTIHVEMYDDEDWYWAIHRKITIGGEICSCEDDDQLLKPLCKTPDIAIKRAISSLNKWRRENL
jgi:hypothetical protein